MSRLLGAVLVSFAFSSLASAGIVRDDKTSDDWEILVAPYLWGVALEGDAGAGDAIIPVDASFGDILDNLDIAASLQTEIHKGNWAFVFDPTYLSLEAEVELPAPITSEADIDIWLVELWGSYKFSEYWELLGGVRYQDQDISVTGLGAVPSPPAPPGGFPDPVNIGDNWLDWFAGFRGKFPLGAKWVFSGRADVVFAGDSDSGYNIELFFNRRIGKTMLLNLGYRYLNNDYDNLPTYSWDVKQQGPVVGYTWAF